MNDEIKEILVSLNSQCKNAKGCINSYFKVKDIEQLLDYITNLQEENERLKEKIAHYEKTITFGDYVKEVNLLIDYKSRCEKAIEYIKENQEEEYVSGNPMLSYWAIDNLLNILQNGSDSE